MKSKKMHQTGFEPVPSSYQSDVRDDYVSLSIFYFYLLHTYVTTGIYFHWYYKITLLVFNDIYLKLTEYLLK